MMPIFKTENSIEVENSGSGNNVFWKCESLISWTALFIVPQIVGRFWSAGDWWGLNCWYGCYPHARQEIGCRLDEI